VNDPAYGIIGTPLSIDFVKEVNVVSGGYMPEYGRSTGGVLDVVTKSGGNEFHGSIFFNLTPGIFEGTPAILKREGTTVSTDQSLSSIRDFGFEIGGPIIKDKLWFFAGLDFAFTSRNLERNLNAIQFDAAGVPIIDEEGFTTTKRIPNTTTLYRAEERSIQYIGKLTYQLNQDNSLTLSIYGAPTTSGGDGAYGIDPQTGNVEIGRRGNTNGDYTNLAHKYVGTANDIALKWSSAYDNKWVLFDVMLGWYY